MNKKDCKIGMFVSVMQNLSSLSKNRLKVKKIGKIVGIYDNYVNLLLYESNIKDIENINDINTVVIIKRKLYIESYRFYEINNIGGRLIWENI